MAYAEVRVALNAGEEITVRNGAIGSIDSAETGGIGVRVLCNGAWGFAGTTVLSARAARETGRRALDVARLEDAEFGLRDLKGLVALDEIQRRPDLFPTLRVLADRPRRPARFLVLGSASPNLLRQRSESLAGRIAYHELIGLTLDEVGIEQLNRLWLRGGFPRSYMARSNADSRA